MGTLGRIGTLVGYEWRRALAKKSVLALLILAISIQALAAIDFYEMSRASGGGGFGGVSNDFIWIVIMTEVLFFVEIIAIVIAGGSMAEEYEHGTADLLLSKPIRRIEYMFGKFLGGFSMLVTLEALMTFVTSLLSLGLFGAQNALQYAPLMFLAIAYSSLIFYSLTFMFSELFRKTTLAMLLGLTIYFASGILGALLPFVYDISTRAVPTWAATNFPSLVLSEVITAPYALPAADLGALSQAALIIALYTVASILIAAIRLRKSDVTKKTA